MELDAFSNLEGVGLAAVGGLRNAALAEITDEVRGRLRIVGIDPDEQAVERRDGVDDAEGGFLVKIVRWDFAAHYEVQGAAPLGGGRRCLCGDAEGKGAAD